MTRLRSNSAEATAAAVVQARRELASVLLRPSFDVQAAGSMRVQAWAKVYREARALMDRQPLCVNPDDYLTAIQGILGIADASEETLAAVLYESGRCDATSRP